MMYITLPRDVQWQLSGTPLHHVPHVTCHIGPGWLGRMVRKVHKQGLPALGAFALC